MYSIYPVKVEEQDVMETFFVNSLWKDHNVNFCHKSGRYVVDGKREYQICDAKHPGKTHHDDDAVSVRYNTEIGNSNQIPLWLFGFLY